MAKYAIRRISLGSTLKFGFALGLLLSLGPSLLCGLAGSWLVSTAHQVMAGWRDVRLVVLGQPVRFDLIDLLHLGDMLENLRFLDQNDWLFALLLIVTACCVTALALGLSANLLTLGYNALAWLTGGLVIELRELDAGERRREVVVEHIERPLVSPREAQRPPALAVGEEERGLPEAVGAAEEEPEPPGPIPVAHEAGHAQDTSKEDTYTET